MGQKRTSQKKSVKLRLFTLKREFLNIPVHLQTAIAAKTRPAEKQVNLISFVCSSRNRNSDSFEEKTERHLAQ
jgi:hypothetical protein